GWKPVLGFGLHNIISATVGRSACRRPVWRLIATHSGEHHAGEMRARDIAPPPHRIELGGRLGRPDLTRFEVGVAQRPNATPDPAHHVAKPNHSPPPPH